MPKCLHSSTRQSNLPRHRRLWAYATTLYGVSIVGALFGVSGTGWEFWVPFALGLLVDIDSLRMRDA